jgi:hypothetical protein
MKPLDFLEPILQLLDNNLDVLPAVGGAVEELLRPDVDEIEDMLINAESREVTDFLETPAPDVRNIYRPPPPHREGGSVSKAVEVPLRQELGPV